MNAALARLRPKLAAWFNPPLELGSAVRRMSPADERAGRRGYRDSDGAGPGLLSGPRRGPGAAGLDPDDRRLSRDRARPSAAARPPGAGRSASAAGAICARLFGRLGDLCRDPGRRHGPAVAGRAARLHPVPAVPARPGDLRHRHPPAPLGPGAGDRAISRRRSGSSSSSPSRWRWTATPPSRAAFAGDAMVALTLGRLGRRAAAAGRLRGIPRRGAGPRPAVGGGDRADGLSAPRHSGRRPGSSSTPPGARPAGPCSKFGMTSPYRLGAASSASISLAMLAM